MTSDLTGCILPDPSSSQDGRSHRSASLCLPLVSVGDVRNQGGCEESVCFVCSTSLQEKQSVHSWDLETRRHAVSPVLTQNSRCLCLGPHFSLERSWTELNNVRLSPSALHLVTNLGRNPRTECTCMGYLLTVSSLYFCEKTGAIRHSVFFSVMTSSAFSFVLLIFMKSLFVFSLHCSQQ